MRVALKDLGAVGFVPDQEGYELPPNGLTLANNVRMSAGYAERIGGHGQVFDATTPTPYYITSFMSATADYIVHAGVASVYVDNGSARTEITGTAPTGTAADRWTGGQSTGYLILNNGVDVPMSWDGNTSNNLVSLTAWTGTWRCKALRPFKQFLVALNITKGSTNYPHMVKWSHAADPGALPSSWDETDPAVDAGEQDLADTPDKIVDGLPLGDIFVIYKERSMYGMQYIGAPLIWRFFRLPGDAGMLARGCAAQTPAGHVVLTNGDVIVHNGQGPRSIVDGRVRRWLFETMDATNYAASFVAHHSAKQEAWICFPESGQSVCTKALVWNYAENTFSTRDLPSVTYAAPGVCSTAAGGGTWATVAGTWATITGSWASLTSTYSRNQERLWMCTSNKEIFVADESGAADGASIIATIERTGIALDDPERKKMIRAVWPKIDGPSGAQVSIQFGACDSPAASPSWASAITYTVGTSDRLSTPLVAGKYLAFRVTSNDTRAWRVRSMDVDVQPLGQY